MTEFKDWLDPLPVDVPAELLEAFGPEAPRPFFEILIRRGIKTANAARAFLDPELYRPAATGDFPGIMPAVERIAEAVQAGQKIAIWGDFDVDGQTATTVLFETLQSLPGSDVTFHIPLRSTEGHGVNIPELEKLISSGARLVISCDTGISDVEAVEFARQRGVDFIITDHHDLPQTLPRAAVLINPKLPGAPDSLRTLPGVGVAYKLAEALALRYGLPDLPPRFLDLVALGIVADVAEQAGETRYLLQQGLPALQKTRRLGLDYLIEQARVSKASLSEDDIGFYLAPRLNALGRLGDANRAVTFYSTTDAQSASDEARYLGQLNEERQRLSEQIVRSAIGKTQANPELLNYAAVVLDDPAWHQGVVGLAASQLADYFHKPVVLLSADANGMAQGSARSVEGIDISVCIEANRDLLIRFGGHPMAAGLAIQASRIHELRRGLSEQIELRLGRVAPMPLQPDAVVRLCDLTKHLIEWLLRLAPFGAGNPKPVLTSRNLRAASITTMGRSKEHRAVEVVDESGCRQRVVWWRGAQEKAPTGKFDLAYHVGFNTFRGNREIQVTWVGARPLS